MTNHVARLYALAGAILVFLLAWAVVAVAHPWQAPAKAAPNDPRLAQLAQREQRLRHEQVRVQRIVERRWARYHKALAARKKEIAAANARQRAALAAPPSISAAAPAVRVVTLPPLTSTQSS